MEITTEWTGTGPLGGAVCAVVGGSAGIGKATVRRLVEAGATVPVLARGERRLHEVVDELGPRTVPVVVDVADPASVRRAFAEIDTRCGRLDSVHCVAGVSRIGRVEDMTDDDVAYVMGVNLLGPIHVARAVVPLMRRSGGGTIVNVSSEAAFDAPPLATLYAASKAGLNGFTTLLTRELRSSGIRVVLCVAGRTAGTDFGVNFSPEARIASREAMAADGYFRRVAGEEPMSVDDVAEVLTFVVTRPASVMLDVVHVRAAR